MTAKEMAAAVLDAVRKAIATATKSLEERFGDLSERFGQLEQAVAEIPAGRDGRDGQKGEKGDRGEAGRDGASIAVEQARLIVADVARQMPGGERGPAGKDGADAPPITAEQILEALKASPGLLTAALKIYLTENPPPAGKDGANGKDADPISEEAIAKSVASHLALNPPPAGRDGRDGLAGTKGADGRDGKDGTNGADGFSLDEFDASLAPDGRTVLLSFGSGERMIHKHLVFPVPIYRGVFREGDKYELGDSVTFGGSTWIAQKDAPDGKPAEDSASWRLSVKRGRDGRDGANGRDFVTPVKLPATGAPR